MSDVKVLHVIGEMGAGGAESLVCELVERGAAVGWHSAVASAGGSRATQLVETGTPHFVVPLVRRSARRILRARAAVSVAVEAVRPDVIVAHNVSATLTARLCRPSVPILTVFHGVAERDYRNAARVLTHASDHVVAVAQAIADRLTAAGLRRVGATVISNAVRETGGVSQTVARAELGIPADVKVGLCLARMVPQKRHDVLLQAWERLSGDETLLLAGDGPLRSELEDRARAMGQRVRFLGNRSDVPRLLAAADVTVLTSDWEGLPMALLESLAAGRPAVATDVDGVRAVLAPGGGRLVPPGDAGAVAAALRELLHDDYARATAARLGLTTVRQSFDPDAMMRRYDELIRETLTRGLSCAS